jgi:myo-inositol-1(or 4)-monophosphatase
VQTYLEMVGKAAHAGCQVRRAGSGALGLAYVAAGRCEGYAEAHINAWDVAAGLLLVTEAGGRVNDFWAGDGTRSGNPVLATSAALASELSVLTSIPLR